MARLATQAGRWITALALGAGSALAAESVPSSHVTVHPTPPVIMRHVYDAAHPPPELKAAAADELGVCMTEFGCSAQLRTQWTKLGRETGPATLTEVTITTRTHIAIWTVRNSGPAVAAHEETHRLISEHFYALADPVVRRLGASLIGRRVAFVTTRGGSQPAIEPIERALIASYMAETSGRCEFAQERFDAITDHARNRIPNDLAMRQALAEEAAHWLKGRKSPFPPR